MEVASTAITAPIVIQHAHARTLCVAEARAWASGALTLASREVETDYSLKLEKRLVKSAGARLHRHNELRNSETHLINQFIYHNEAS